MKPKMMLFKFFQFFYYIFLNFIVNATARVKQNSTQNENFLLLSFLSCHGSVWLKIKPELLFLDFWIFYYFFEFF